MKKGEIYQGKVIERKFPNKAIVDNEGENVTVKDALPGQIISYRVTKKRSGKAEGRLLEVINKADNEIDSPCPHYCFNTEDGQLASCGGCSYQTLSYEDQVKLKTDQVKKLMSTPLKRQTIAPVWEETVYSPTYFGYRNKMEFSFGDAKKGGALELGMHKKGSFHDIVTVDDCQIVDEDFRNILKITLDFFRENNVSYMHRMSHEGFLRNLLVRKAAKTGELLVALVTTSENALKEKSNEDLARINGGNTENVVLDKADGDNNNTCAEKALNERTTTESHLQNKSNDDLINEWKERILENEGNMKGSLAGILHITNDSLADIVQADKLDVLYGRDYINEEILGLKFKISVFSFFQTNSLGAEKLYDTARRFIGDIGCDEEGRPDKILFDLYSGTGTIAQIMSTVAKKVIGVEIVEEAVEAAKENARLNGLDNCEFLAGDVLKVIDSIEEKPDFLILDPPRDGIHPKALPKLIAYDVDRILYISCKPTSLARDLEVFIDNGYQATRIACVDMFPMTNGIETVCLLSNRKADAKIRIDVDLEDYYAIKDAKKSQN